MDSTLYYYYILLKRKQRNANHPSLSWTEYLQKSHDYRHAIMYFHEGKQDKYTMQILELLFLIIRLKHL